ncbi:hypothetical protein [Catenulispora subtropica]|uniref:Uncharacterized protein n=1 Tax=Catenulispora subtropica TaxID=450798 RepID=A0ABP5CK43_9ACTN
MTTFPTSPLGTTGMQLTRIGFEAWAVGGADWRYTWGAQDDGESIATIRAAVESGGDRLAARLRLTHADLAEVEDALTATGAGTGPVRPGRPVGS